jgi:Xaa-Pro dipeptidase
VEDLVTSDIVWQNGSAPRGFAGDAMSRAGSLRDLTFDPLECADRVRRLRAAMRHRDLDGVVTFRASSVEYLCGFNTIDRSPQPLLITHDGTYLFVPKAEVGSAWTTASGPDIVASTSAFHPGVLANEVAARTPANGRIATAMGWRGAPHHFIATLETSRRLVDDQSIVEHLRLTLSTAEQELVRSAAAATEAGYAAAIANARHAATERELAAAITHALFANGSSPAATHLILTQGPRIGIPHSTWSERPLTDGLVFAEFGGAHRRYVAPVMMTLARGPVGAVERRLEELSITMLESAARNLRAGRIASEVAGDVAADLGDLDDTLFHNVFGYPVGLAHPPSWMDAAPFYITKDNHERVCAGMAFHLPATFRLLAATGVGLSHTVIVHDDGVEILTGQDRRIHDVSTGGEM